MQRSSDRLSKSKQLAQNALKLTSQRSSVTLLPNSLMPKRIMSKSKNNKKTDRSNDKSQNGQSPEFRENYEEVARGGKGLKDRSALVGLKRTRKSRDQIYQL